MSTISEVARLAGVSTATVSKYLNGIRVKDENAASIDSAVKQLSFQPNDFARGLRTSRSLAVGVLLPELRNLFFTSIISSVDEILNEAGYGTLVCVCHSDVRREKERLDFLRRRRIDGLIAVPCSSASDFVDSLDGLPTVLIDRIAGGSKCVCVLSDNYKASRDAAELFITAGHTRIGLLTGPDSNYTPIERRAGFTEYCAERSVELPPEYVRTGEYTIESGYEMTRALLALPVPPSAIYATNNELTIGAVTALNELGKVPGKDISFIGFDNVTLARSASPRLTVFVQQTEELGRVAARTLLGLIRGATAAGVSEAAEVESSHAPDGAGRADGWVIRLPAILAKGESVIKL